MREVKWVGYRRVVLVEAKNPVRRPWQWKLYYERLPHRVLRDEWRRRPYQGPWFFWKTPKVDRRVA